ncbi:MAG: N-acetylmuramate alpha-1-phosphate uridylyltransferase MurU [Gammaproteobacteria bacterium]
MRGMILAAGRGQRMGTLTTEVPKPLLQVRNRYLIEYSLFALIKMGITEIVINICYRGAQIKEALGDGSRYGVTIFYSEEDEALETGGGIFQALPLLGPEPFIVLSCDVITDYPLHQLPQEPIGLAHLVLVNNPLYHSSGDFCLLKNKVYCGQSSTLTFGNIGIYRPELFADCKPGKFGLGPLLKEAALHGKITGEHYQGIWHNLGRPDDFDQVNGFPDNHLQLLFSKA